MANRLWRSLWEREQYSWPKKRVTWFHHASSVEQSLLAIAEKVRKENRCLAGQMEKREDFREGVRKAAKKWVRLASVHAPGDPHCRDDVIQEGLRKVFEYSRSFKGLNKAKWASWATTIFCNELKKRYLRQGRNNETGSTTFNQPVDVADVERRALSRLGLLEARARLDRCSADLTPNHRKVLNAWLKRREGEGYDEVSRRLGLSSKAFKAKLNRARGSLKRRWEIPLRRVSEERLEKAA